MRCTPTHVVDVQTAIRDVGAQGALGEQTNPRIGGAAGALAVLVVNGGLVVEDDVFVRSGAADDAVENGHRSGGGSINGSATDQFSAVKAAERLAVDACP